MKATKQSSEARRFFPDASFPLKFCPDKIASVDDPTVVSRALHEAIELKYFCEGTGTLLIGTETLEVQAGDLVVINPYELHSTIHLGRERGHYHLLMISPDLFMDGGMGGLDLRTMMLKGGLTFKTLIRGDARVADMMRRLRAAYAAQSAYWQVAVRGILLELFALLLCEYAEERAGSARGNFGAFETVEPALRRIREDYASPITLEELAELCNVSKCHFCRIFRLVTGESPMRYLTEYRLKIADILLASSGESIRAVAEKCGFSDQACFCQCYKAHYGIPPSQKRSEQI